MPEQGEDAAAQVTHIAGLSVDLDGIPRAWFVTNRWVTDEFLYPADVVIGHLDRYNVDNTMEDALVNRFLTAMVALYRNEVADLLHKRDRKLAELTAARGASAYESGHGVLGCCRIDLDAKIASLVIA